MEHLQSNSVHLWVVLVTVLCTLCVVLINYEALLILSRRRAMRSHHSRRHILQLVFGLLLAHLLSITVFGLGCYGLLQMPDAGSLLGSPSQSLTDSVYFSASSYATLGYGDVIPRGPVRLLASITSLTGFMMITWSASATFLEMQRHW